MSKPTIIHVINNLGIGGAEVLLTNTIPLLDNYEHVLICLSRPETLLKKVKPHVKAYYSLGITQKNHWIKGIGKIRNILRQHKPALVHSHLQLSSLLTRLACPSGMPLVFTIHSTYSRDAFRHNRLALLLEKLIARKRHALIGVSRFVIDDYLDAVPFKGKTFTLYNFVPSIFFDAVKISSPSNAVLKLVAVGSLKDAKNYSFLLEAFKGLPSCAVQLDIYGEGPEKSLLQQTIDNYDLPVRLMGRANELEKILPQYDAYIICSKHEGYGLAPLEAMACGLPVLASDIPVLREVIGTNALFFDIHDPAGLAQKIKTVVDNNDILKDLSGKSRERAVEIASQEKYKKDINAIYNDLIKQ
jgi:glycosyltransferase involved in cell wall biosynthesis